MSQPKANEEDSISSQPISLVVDGAEPLENDLDVMPPPPVKKRRRTVNKIDQDPESLPLCDLLFYNPPETIYQKENRQVHEEQSEQQQPQKTQKVQASPVIKTSRSSSRSSSVCSDKSNKDKIKSSKEPNATDKDLNDLPAVELDEEENYENDDDESIASSLTEEKPAVDDNDDAEQTLTIDEEGNIVFKNPSRLTKKEPTKPTVEVKSSTTYNSFRRRERSKNTWNAEETGAFYTALEIVGTDFTLMEAVFFKNGTRDRKQLKQKFKREEKINRAFIDDILFRSLHNRSKFRPFSAILESDNNKINGNDKTESDDVNNNKLEPEQSTM